MTGSESSPHHLHYEEQANVAVITYDRPDCRNAMNNQTYRELVAAVERANSSEAVGAIVLTHNGPVFCSGIDLKAQPLVGLYSVSKEACVLLGLKQ